MIEAKTPAEFLALAAQEITVKFTDNLLCEGDRIKWLYGMYKNSSEKSIFSIREGQVALYINLSEIKYANAALQLLDVPLKIVSVHSNLEWGDIENPWGKFCYVNIWHRPLAELVDFRA